jgi:outer membrane protein TolC
MRSWTVPAFLSVFCLLSAERAQPAEPAPRVITLQEVLVRADQISPDLKASIKQEQQASYSRTQVISNLLPQLDLSAVESWGYPGSSSPVPPEFGGLLTSPFRKGVAGGALGRWTLLDIGYWRGLKEADATLAASSEQTRITRMRSEQTALDLYFEAARLRGEGEAWKNAAEKLSPVLESVKNFVKNGQTSEVQRLLLEYQLSETQMQQAITEQHYQGALKRLALFIGVEESQISCPTAKGLDREALLPISTGTKSPFIGHAEARVAAAKAAESRALAAYLPKLYAVGCAGWIEGSRMVNKQNVSAWVGATIPIFEGLAISAEVGRARAAASEMADALSSTQLNLDDLNVRLDETIESSVIQLDFLQKQKILAENAFIQAKERYLNFLEPVLNLQEAIKNLVRIEMQLNGANADLLKAEASKRLINGGLVNSQ